MRETFMFVFKIDIFNNSAKLLYFHQSASIVTAYFFSFIIILIIQ